MGVPRRLFVGLAALCSAVTLAACGEEDFENSPRPPSPIELSARIGDDGVTVSPRDVGAGLATITISNQTPRAERLVLEGPTDEASDEIIAGGTGSLKIALEQGDYEVTDGGGARITELVVGPERESSQNELGLP
ncbi:MAG TPA: hypothetical protein VD765_03365 [Solirubrobacterales bacterium]|nr:hypothetical protein [Solirubrobacterales bacterium]